MRRPTPILAHRIPFRVDAVGVVQEPIETGRYLLGVAVQRTVFNAGLAVAGLSIGCGRHLIGVEQANAEGHALPSSPPERRRVKRSYVHQQNSVRR